MQWEGMGGHRSARKDADVVAVKHRPNQRLRLRVHIFLRTLLGEDLVKRKHGAPLSRGVVDCQLALLPQLAARGRCITSHAAGPHSARIRHTVSEWTILEYM